MLTAVHNVKVATCKLNKGRTRSTVTTAPTKHINQMVIKAQEDILYMHGVY